MKLDEASLLDGKWCKVPDALFGELLSILQNEEERVEPTRQELVSYGQTVADKLESYLTSVREQLAEKQGVLADADLTELEISMGIVEHIGPSKV